MMSQNISVDILLPTYNGESYLKEQIESILNQSYNNLRLIIRDDGSKDRTIEIINDFLKKDSRVIYLENKEGNLGLVKSIEKMMMFSDAEIIFFSDQDDVWIENKIDIFLQKYKNQDIPVLIHSNCNVTDEALNVRGLFFSDAPKKQGLQNSFFNYFVQGASAMINKKLKESLLPFSEEVYIHDRYFHLMAEILGKRIYIDEPTMLYRQHGKNLIGSQTIFEKIKNNLNLKRFYINQDKVLFYKLAVKFPDNKILKLYKDLTSDKVSRFKKINLISKNNINLRWKEKILLLIKN
ncbi:glycosyltransferase family 2 protein [Chryseobacterium sp. MMS23-Vi53]|uniref:glycosyltransferase family 2 protein n=1 Tax=Chryseobacterium sp. MMS23-Vi53 TaxID=3386644 RepID=UPI0039EA1C71